jgi:phosphohistidine phosphatase
VLHGHADAPDAGAAGQAVDRARPADFAGEALYLASEETLLAHLKAVTDDVATVLLIAHNDGIWHLAEVLAGSGSADALASLREKYPTGTLATLRVPDRPWRDLALGSAELTAFVRPRDLAVT